MNLTRKSLYGIAGAWVVSLGLAFLAGIGIHIRFSGENAGDLGTNGGFASEMALERHLLIRKLTGKSLQPDASRESFSPPVREALEAALGDANTNFRNHAFAVIFSGLALGDIGEAVGFAKQLPAGVRRDEVFAALLRRWGELDGRSALAFALEQVDTGSRDKGIVEVLAGWATYDPQTSYQWALANAGDNPFQSERLNAVIGQIAVGDPATAFAYAAELPVDSFRTGALRTIADQLHAEGKLSMVLPWFANLTEGPVKEVTLEHVARIWSSYEPVFAAEWVEQNSGQVIHVQAMSAVAATWGRTDPLRAADWAGGLPTGGARSAGVSAAVGTWLDLGEVNAVAGWLNRQPPHQDFDDAVRKVALASMLDDAETAMSWAESIIDENLRSVTMNIVGRRWMSLDPGAAQAYYGQSEQATGPAETYVIGAPGMQAFQSGSAVDTEVQPLPTLDSLPLPIDPGVDESYPPEENFEEPIPLESP